MPAHSSAVVRSAISSGRGIPIALGAVRRRVMNAKIAIPAAFACAASIGGAAQTPTGASGATNNTASTNAITVTGCVQNISSKDVVGTTARGYLLALNGDGRGATTPTPMATPGSTEGAAAGR